MMMFINLLDTFTVEKQKKIYIIEYMSRLGTGSNTRRRTSTTGSVPPQCIC